MPISSQVPIIGYVANGVTKSFAFPFAILSADDLKVKVGADVVTAGFSIAGVGDRDGGSVTFTDAPASLTPIILYREVTLDRTTDYQENGDLLAIVLDDDLDRIWMALQDQLLLSDRALRSPLGETMNSIPKASERALTVLGFDALGQPVAVTRTEDGGAALALDLLNPESGKGASLVGVSLTDGAPSTVKAALQNLDTALNFSTLPVASSPVADTDLMVLRQGGANKQLPVSVVRAEFATNAVAAAAAATAAKDGAVVAKTAAEAARDATVVGAAPTVYATTAAGLAATTNGQYFSVPSADSAEYLILYLNNAGVAVEQKRYPSKEAIDAIPLVVSSLPTLDVDAEILMDGAGNIARRTTESGHMLIPHVPAGSVQDALSRQERIADDVHMAVPGDSLVVADVDGNISLRQDGAGRLFIPGLPGSVQEALGYSVTTSVYRDITARDALTPAIKSYVQDLIIEGHDFIHPPALLVPNNMGALPDAIVSVFTVSEANEKDLYTPYGFGGTVHPYLLEMRRPILGYRYLMSETPHQNGSALDENPILYGSNDLLKFELIQGVDQPFDMPIPIGDSWMPDASLGYDPRTGVLYMFYPWKSQVRWRSTRNGRDWSPIRYFTLSGAGLSLSPTILFDPVDGLWHMWSSDSARIVHRTNPNLDDNWTIVSTFDTRTLATNPFVAWHLEVKRIGSKFVCLANQKETWGGSGPNLYLGISNDGDTWVFGAPMVNPQPANVYKGTFIPEFNGNNLRLHIAWNRYGDGYSSNMKFFCEPTNWVDLSTL